MTLKEALEFVDKCYCNRNSIICKGEVYRINAIHDPIFEGIEDVKVDYINKLMTYYPEERSNKCFLCEIVISDKEYDALADKLFGKSNDQAAVL